jgi:hypothetical protein
MPAPASEMRQRPSQRVLEAFPGDPEHLCRNCEHFDAGGLDAAGNPRNKGGDCHNSISGRFQTYLNQGCEVGFYPCTLRWPLKAGTGGVR